MHINKINGKIYVGITKQKAEERWRNGKGYKHCILFYRAIQKYGWDGFEHIIFASHLTKEEAMNMEKILIQNLQTRDVDYGYNISEGGDAPQLSEETKKKISETHIGILNPMFAVSHTEEWKNLLSKRMSGEKNPNYGKKHSDATRKKISEALKNKHTHLSDEQKSHLRDIMKDKMKGRPRPEGGGRKPKPVVCVETNEVFESVADAARAKDIKSKTNICSCLKGKAKTCGGYHWEYYNSFIV